MDTVLQGQKVRHAPKSATQIQHTHARSQVQFPRHEFHLGALRLLQSHACLVKVRARVHHGGAEHALVELRGDVIVMRDVPACRCHGVARARQNPCLHRCNKDAEDQRHRPPTKLLHQEVVPLHLQELAAELFHVIGPPLPIHVSLSETKRAILQNLPEHIITLQPPIDLGGAINLLPVHRSLIRYGVRPQRLHHDLDVCAIGDEAPHCSHIVKALQRPQPTKSK
mmetsp:Transcript_2142/g.5987  ORF Transcript_2142/g.5987 Transcript_2142/m.5987 type:complete len:225 (-) Transcript_2142:444-1118(-)